MIETERVAHIMLAGSPRERGRAHGETARSAIAHGVRRWKDALERTTSIPADSYIARLLQSTNFVPAIERWTPALLEEVRGIGEGAGIPFDEIYAYQLMDEEWLFRRRMITDRERQALEHCSTLAVFGENGAPPVVGQNMDLPKYYDGTQTLLQIKHEDSPVEAFVFTAAGLIGLCGMNNQSVGVCVNTLNQLNHAHDGLPVAFVTRRLLESKTQAEAVAFVRGIKHAAGQNYAIGGPDIVVDYECSAARAVQFQPHVTRITHTNHPLANDDLMHPPSGLQRGALPGVADRSPMSNSEARLAVLDEVAGDSGTGIDAETIKAVLRTIDVPVSVSRQSEGDAMTLGSVVMELGTRPVLHYAPGPPAETAYSRWTF